MAKRGARRASRRSGPSEQEVYLRISGESDFAELRRRYRRFAFPATIGFMVWYITYVVCNNWARDFMNTKVVGNINVALVFGLLQFLTTFLLAWHYSNFSTAKLDPLARQLDEDYMKNRRGGENA